MLSECYIIHINNENMTKKLDTKRGEKNELKRFEDIKLVFAGNDLSHFVSNKTKLLFDFLGIHDMREYNGDIQRNYVNAS